MSIIEAVVGFFTLIIFMAVVSLPVISPIFSLLSFSVAENKKWGFRTVGDVLLRQQDRSFCHY